MTEPTSLKELFPSRILTPRIVFIGGVHGVGKTTFSQRLSGALGASAYSAGALISSFRETESKKGKAVTDIVDNQNLLLRALKSLQVVEPYIILDGHFCVRDQTGAIRKIPEETYISLGIAAIIILREEAAVIRAQLQSRDGGNPSLSEIQSLQVAEVDYAVHIASLMKIPHINVGNSETEQAIALIRSQMSHSCAL